MVQSLACGKCGSTEVVPRARVIDRGHFGRDEGEVRVGVERKPMALMFRQKEVADLYARVCGKCGFVELFCDDAAAIYAAYQQGRSNSA